MKIELLINPELPNSGEIQAEMNSEINALRTKDVHITSKTAAPPEGTLALNEVYQFIIEHQDTITKSIPLIAAVLQVIASVLKRRGIEHKKPAATKKSKKKSSKKKTKSAKPQPAVVVIVDGHQIKLPSTAQKEKEFLKTVTEEPTKTNNKTATSKSTSKRQRK
jgi:hypothetical protein